MMKLQYLLVFLFLSSNLFAQSFVQFGNRLYPILCDTVTTNYTVSDLGYFNCECLPVEHFVKENKVPKFYSLKTRSYANSDPTYSNISITDGVKLDSVITQYALVDTLRILKDSLFNMPFKVVIKSVEHKIIGYNMWLINSRSVFIHSDIEDGFREISRWVNEDFKKGTRLLFTDLFYQNGNTICHIPFEMECALW